MHVSPLPCLPIYQIRALDSQYGSTTMRLSLALLTVLISLAHGFFDSGCSGRRTTLVSSPLFDGSSSSEPDTEGRSRITSELFEDDETLRAREIAESVAKAKAAVVSDVSPAKEDAAVVEDTSTDVGSQTTMVMDKQAKEELDELKFQVGKVDEERVRQLEAKEAEMQRMKFSLMDLTEQAAESERKANEAEKTIKKLQAEGEGAQEERKGLIARIKEQFRKEKDELTNEVKSISEQLQQEKDKAAKEIAEAEASVDVLEQQLKMEVAELESALVTTEKSLSNASKEAQEMRERHRDELNQQKKEAARLQQASDRIAAQDKRQLRNRTWGLQSALDDAKYDLMMAQKEIGKLKAERVGMEEQLIDLQNDMMNTIADVKSQLEAEKIQMKKNVINAIASSKTEKYQALRLTGIKYDALVAMNAQKLTEAQEAAEAKVRFARQEMNVRLKDAKKMYDRDVLALREQNEVVRADAASKINSMKKTLKIVENDLANQKVVVAALRQERKSFRKIGNMALQLVKERSSRVRDRVVGKIARRNRKTGSSES